jgi:hypothetical protein
MTDADTISVGIQFPIARHAERTAQVHRLITASLMFTFRLVAFVHGAGRSRMRTMMPNNTLQRTRRGRRGCNRCAPCAG